MSDEEIDLFRIKYIEDIVDKEKNKGRKLCKKIEKTKNKIIEAIDDFIEDLFID